MNARGCVIQEIIQIPSEDAEFTKKEIADLIDYEVGLERIDNGGGIVKVDSVSVEFGNSGDGRIKSPFVHSGREFCDFVERSERFWRGIK